MRLGLVLGGGGLVGLGYHAGVLKALDETGIDVAGSDVVVGTSAGSIIGSYLGAGWSQTDFYEYAHGRHANSVREEADQKAEVQRIFTPAWHDGGERVRRSIGSFFALAASRGYWSKAFGGREPHPRLKKMFPSGMYATDETDRRLHEDLPDEWPRDDLFICAVDLFSGERVPFGHPTAPPATLPDAVLASTAIPGVFPAVRIGDRHYVDGGAASATSLDLAADAGCDAIICVAPLGYKNDVVAAPRDPKLWGPMMMRALFARSLRREVNAARERGIDVLVIRPWLTELKSHGTNSMRHFDRTAFTDATVEGTLRLLEESDGHPALEAFRTRAADQKAG